MTKFGMSGLLLAFTLMLASYGASAGPDDAPTPRKMPRTPVARENLVNQKSAPPPRNVEGVATVIDTERLRVGDVEVRLFGIVPPQLSASYGPQARVALDKLTAGGVSCVIRDRDRDGRLLATCHNNANNHDVAEEILKRGLAVTARGSLRTTELADAYMAAEQGAESQKLGLWSVATTAAPSAGSVAMEQAARDKDQAVKDNMLANLIASATGAAREEPKVEAAKAPIQETAPPPVKVEAPIVSPPKAEPVIAPAKTEAAPPAVKADKEAKAAPAAAPLPPVAKPEPAVLVDLAPVVAAPAAMAAAVESQGAPRSFIERYQLLISGMLMLFTALGIVLAILAHRWLDRRDELRSIAAALRGELQAARAVCLGRLQTLAQETDERNAAWPRIRVMVFQAYVGRIGRLGAELARQIASIYGQASDYSTYYQAATHGSDGQFEPVSKQQALQTLVQHIEEVVPRLAQIEQHGALLAMGVNSGRGPKPPHVTGPRPGTALPHVRKLASASEAPPKALPHKAAAGKGSPRASDETSVDDMTHGLQEPVAADLSDVNLSATIPAEKDAIPDSSMEPAKAKEPAALIGTATFAAATTALAVEAAAIAAEPSSAEESSAPIAARPLWGLLRKFATERQERPQKETNIIDDYIIPDYDTMTDEELEALAYAIDNEDDLLPSKKQGVG